MESISQTSRGPSRGLLWILLTVSALAALAGSAEAAKKRAPEGRTYSLYLIGLEEDRYAPQVDCLTFGTDQACTLDGGICIDWWHTETGLQTHHQSGIAFAAELVDDEGIISMDGQGRVDDRGGKSSLTLVATASVQGTRINFAVAGRQAPIGRCRRMVETFAE